MEPVRESLHTCAATLPGIALFIDVVPQNAQDFASSDLILWWGEEPADVTHAFQIAEEELVIIVNSENPNSNLSNNELRGLFSGGVEHWDEISIFEEPVSVWIYPEESYPSQVFGAQTMGDQGFSRVANLAPSPGPMLIEVSENTGAIGFVPRAWITADPTPVAIDGDLQTSLRRPILALANSEPQSGVRDLLGCLQSGEGQTKLSSVYPPLSN